MTGQPDETRSERTYDEWCDEITRRIYAEIPATTRSAPPQASSPEQALAAARAIHQALIEPLLADRSRLEQERDEAVAKLGPCHCDGNPATTNGPEEDCPQHGRPYSYWVEGCQTLAAREAGLRDERDKARADAAAARTEVTRLGRDLDEAEGLLRDWLVWGKAIADALGLNYDTDQERDERMIADAMRMRAAIDEAVRMCNGPGSAQSEASQVKKRVGGVLAAALGGVPEDEPATED